MSEREPRAWSLEAARAVIPDVRRRTERAVKEIEALIEGRSQRELDADAERRGQIERVVSLWVREMEALGADVKGLWLVDFDNGNGYFCWKWPEDELEHFHGYDDGFDARTRIQ